MRMPNAVGIPWNPWRVVAALLALGALCSQGNAAEPNTPLPPGVHAVWDLSKAYRQTTLTRGRVCLNGLWCWQPAKDGADVVPADRWGYFKVPGCWPGITDYMQKDCQTVHAHPSWKDENLRSIRAAWYQREITIPDDWAGRRIAVQTEYLNSYAVLYLDGKKVGEMRFPGGEVDVTSACPPGSKHVLSMLVVAMPLKGVMLSYSDTASAKEVKGTVERRGLCGDVYLVATPAEERIDDVKVDTSVRKSAISFDAALGGLKAGKSYVIRARIEDKGRPVKEFASPRFKAEDLKEGRYALAASWKPDRLWDIHTPQNQYDLSLSLVDEAGKVLDASQNVRFGFREFWIDGRDFYLNGTRLFLSVVPVDNAQIGAAAATYQAAKESFLRLQAFGINCIYTHNYGCEPGSHLGFAEILQAADDVGMLVAFSQPHLGHYTWDAPDADARNGYARHAEFYVRAAGSHPSVVMYSMSHNATGYSEDMNPDLIDGAYDKRDSWAMGNVKKALRAEGIVRKLDPGRIVYHHSSGNLSSMHTSNFYPNFVPVQEMSDWFEHWATQGVKPLFLCEYAAPMTWDWAMYRGWYKGKRTFGSAQVPWEFCLAEWNAQFFGDPAFQISRTEKENLRWEAAKFREGKLWYRWDYPHQIGSRDFDERYPVLATYTTDNWRAFRTWGVSAINTWEYSTLWKPRDGVARGRKDLQVDWENLQRPGFSPDYIDQQYERMDLAYERSDWVPTVGAQALIRNNRPLLAYLGGKADGFTEKGHNFVPGETVDKQIIVINNSREAVSCECRWSLALPTPLAGTGKVSVETGQQARIPLRFQLPANLAPGRYMLTMKATFAGGKTQDDAFAIHVMPKPGTPKAPAKVALFDPKGQTAKLLGDLGIACRPVAADADLAATEILVIGKHALTLDGAAPNIGRVRDGLKVLVFEQSADVLEKRLGFRVQEYGLRQVFKRAADHPALAGLETEHLRDWRGEATTNPPRLKYETRPMYGPTIRWCGIEVTRPWRCGNRGNVASVLIEKPACGDFLPIVDGGFSLQYSPLLEYREGKGMVLFCQMDVTARTEGDPAVETLVRNILKYVAAWEPPQRREALYAGEAAGKKHLESAGLTVASYGGGPLAADKVLIVGPGGGKDLSPAKDAVAAFLKGGDRLLAIGLGEQEARGFLPTQVTMKDAEHINAYFEPQAGGSLLAGVGPADVHNRAPRSLPLVSGGADVVGDGVLAAAKDAGLVFCQMAPWQFDYSGNYGLKRTFRRTSFLVTRLVANMGAAGSTPLLARFSSPWDASKAQKRWLEGLYLDPPEEWDDPYRFFRW
jgi:beta-galactosidase